MARPLFSVFLCGGAKKNGKKRSGHARLLCTMGILEQALTISFVYTHVISETSMYYSCNLWRKREKVVINLPRRRPDRYRTPSLFKCTCMARFKNTALLKKIREGFYIRKVVLRVGDKSCNNIQELS